MKASLSIAAAVWLLAALPAVAQPQSQAQEHNRNRFAATIVPAERFEVGGMLVERHGERGAPMVLIPGLAGGSWEWEGLVRQFAGSNTLYVVTPAGFDGRPPAAGNPVDATKSAILELVAARKLDKPILVGHSLGGTLALLIASRQPDLPGAVVTIDGLPVFPGTEGMPPEQRAQAAEALRVRGARTPARLFGAQQQDYMRTTGSIDMGKADDMARLMARSDPATVSAFTAGMMALDLRRQLAHVSAPVLVIAPYFDGDSGQHNITEPMKLDYYQKLMAAAPNVKVVPVSPSRHFAMIDQPEKVAAAIRDFVAEATSSRRPPGATSRP